MAPDQRYCLTCGARRGEPRVALAGGSAEPPPVAAAAVEPPPRPADVSPLAAVIGIALLGGMLLIGVLIGRGAENESPGTVVQVERSGGTGVVASEWPEGTEGFTIQLATVTKDGATAESVDAAKQQAISDGASDAAVLDSDLYASLPPGNYMVYSGVYTDRKSAEVALKGLGGGFASAAVVEVSRQGGGPSEDAAAEPPAEVPTAPADDQATEEPPAADAAPPEDEGSADSGGAIVPEAGGEDEVPPEGAAN